MAEVTSDILYIKPIDLEYAGIKKDSLKGEVAVVTGAASNIGLGFARAIAWAGAKVVIVDIKDEAGKETERIINTENDADVALFVKCDITREDEVKALSKAAIAKFGKVDILVNNAMNMRLNGPLLGSSISDLDQSLAICARAVMLLVQEFVPGMIERGHGVVTYSSSQFHYSPPLVGGTMYCVGKAAASSLMMSLANEVKGTGVNVFCITPAGVIWQDPNRPAPPKPKDEPQSNTARSFAMPGFEGFIPPEAGGAAMVYCILNSAKLHGSGIIISDAFDAMNYPYPCPDTVRKTLSRRLDDSELTLVLCNMGAGFIGFRE